MGIGTWLKQRLFRTVSDTSLPKPTPSSSATHDRFMQSTKMGYLEWHDGVPYDMEAFRYLSPSERDAVVRHLSANHGPAFDWRDIQVFQAAATPESIAALHVALQSPRAESRLHAAEALHAMGALPDFAEKVVRELDQVTIVDGMSLALGLVGSALTPQIRDALLRGARDRPEVGPHYAAKLCHLVGKAETNFDWAMRPFFLRFGENASPEDRAQAYLELCTLIDAPAGSPGTRD